MLSSELPHPGRRTLRDHLAATVTDLVADLLYYDRKEDEDLRPGVIDEMVADGTVTVDEIVDLFRREFEKGLQR